MTLQQVQLQELNARFDSPSGYSVSYVLCGWGQVATVLVMCCVGGVANLISCVVMLLLFACVLCAMSCQLMEFVSVA